MGGIKTNTSLFRRILKDPDFRAGKIDTGYLERLLKRPPVETDPRRPIIAAVAAGIFATLDPKATFPGANGLPAPANGRVATAEPSNWRRTAREEGVRTR